MIKKLLFLIFLGLGCLGYGQEKEKDPNRKFGLAFSPGFIQQRNTFLDANLFMGTIITHEDFEVPIVGVMGFRVGVESDLHRTIAPKVGYEIAMTLVTLRLTAADYIQDKNSELRLIPEVGLCVYGWVNITYGYGISLNDGNLTQIGHHRLCISFNLNKRLNETAFP